MQTPLRWFRSVGNKFQARIWAQLARRTPSENAFLALIPVVGAVTGLASMGIAHLIAFTQKYFWGSGERLVEAAQATPWQWRVLVPVGGGAILGIAAWALRRATRGLGVAGLIQALALKSGEVSLRE